MKKMSLREIQLCEVELLKYITEIFEKNDIKYFLFGGTMLGAVRHNGFIPWDDDIDLFVPRESYDKFIKISAKYNTDKIHISLPGDDKYPYPFIKVFDNTTIVKNPSVYECYPLHVWIDIFPLDHFSDNDFIHRIELYRLKFLKAILQVGRGGFKYNGIIKAIFKLLYLFVGKYKKAALIIDNSARKMNNKNKLSKHYGNGVWADRMNCYFCEEWITDLFKHKFEDATFFIPKKYDEFLTMYYGNYMTLPPKDEQISHSADAWKIKEN